MVAIWTDEVTTERDRVQLSESPMNVPQAETVVAMGPRLRWGVGGKGGGQVSVLLRTGDIAH